MKNRVKNGEVKWEEKEFWNEGLRLVNTEQEIISDEIREDIFGGLQLGGAFRDKLLLEIGCGTGRAASLIANKENASVVGIDLSSEIKFLTASDHFLLRSPIEQGRPILFSAKGLYRAFNGAGFTEINVRGAEYVMALWTIFCHHPPEISDTSHNED